MTTTAVDPPPPPLPVELAEPILAICAHLVAAPSMWQLAALAQPLNVLSHTHAPLVTKAVLMNLPEVDLTWATKRCNVALLDFMLKWSKQPRGRPLNYASADIVAIALCGNLNVLDWWLDKSGLIAYWGWEWNNMFRAFCGQHAMHLLEWWKARGYPYLDDPAQFGHVIVEAAREGRVDMLDWLLENIGAEWIVQEGDQGVYALTAAAGSGHVHILQWWVAKAKAGLIAEPEIKWGKVFSAAIRGKRVAVLEWCKQHPQAIEVLRRESVDNVGPKSLNDLVYLDAIRHGLVDWLSEFEMVPFEQEYYSASVEACAKGDLDLVKQLHEKQHLVGSRKQLLHASMAACNLELLDWVQSNIDLSVPVCDHESFNSYQTDSFATACAVGNVGILDWLVANGYKFPDSRQQVPPAPAPAGDPLQHDDHDEEEQHVPSPLGDILLHGLQHVPVLDWLLANGYTSEVSDADLGECCWI